MVRATGQRIIFAFLMVIALLAMSRPGLADPAETNVVHEDTKLMVSDPSLRLLSGDSFAFGGNTTVIGTRGFDSAGMRVTSGHVFTRDATGWRKQSELAFDNLTGPGGNKNAAAVSGDTIVVASRDNTGGEFVHLFRVSGSRWIQQAELTIDEGSYFGRAVAISGDTVLVGAYLADLDGFRNAGAAYVFVRKGTRWIQQAKLVASDPMRFHGFGASVALSGDTALIGARRDDHSGHGSGAAYVFVRQGNEWHEQAKLIADDARPNDRFGTVALLGDTALVGASSGNYDKGAAYVFERDGTDWHQQARLTASDAAYDDVFGGSVALTWGAAVIGAWGDDDFGIRSGAAYVFRRDGTTWVEQSKLIASDAAYARQFGDSVAVSCDTIVIGAINDVLDEPRVVSAYVFEIDDFASPCPPTPPWTWSP